MKNLTITDLEDKATATVQHDNIVVKIAYEMPSTLLLDDMTEMDIEFKKDDASLLNLSKLLFTIEYLWNIDFIKKYVNESDDEHEEFIEKTHASLDGIGDNILGSKTPLETEYLKDGFDLFEQHGLFIQDFCSSYFLLDMTSVSLSWFSKGVEYSMELHELNLTGANDVK